MSKRILITGASFIGSHLCEKLLKEGNEVISVDNYFTGKKKYSTLNKNPNFEIIRHDIVNELRAEVDQIYNFACPASPVHYHNAISTIKTNVLGTMNMLGLAKEGKSVSSRHQQAKYTEIHSNILKKESYWEMLTRLV